MRVDGEELMPKINREETRIIHPSRQLILARAVDFSYVATDLFPVSLLGHSKVLVQRILIDPFGSKNINILIL